MQAEQLALLKAEPKDKKDAQMKTIALSMIFSLAVIVCEQQTLFAPHFTTFDGLTAANPLTSGTCFQRRIVGGTMCSMSADDSPTNSLIPIAGADSFGVTKAHYITLTDGLNPGVGSASLEHGPGMHDSLEHGPGMHDSLKHGLHNNRAFLPWHRG